MVKTIRVLTDDGTVKSYPVLPKTDGYDLLRAMGHPRDLHGTVLRVERDPSIQLKPGQRIYSLIADDDLIYPQEWNEVEEELEAST